LTLAELVSRRILAATEHLGRLTRGIPENMGADGQIAWPEGVFVETDRLIENFKEMTGALAAQFAQVRRINQALEDRVERRTEALRRSEESLSITLHSIGDAVISTDIEGRITRMNAVAERLTGWRFDMARGRMLNEVFRIENARTRKPAENPVRRVLDSGKVVGLANHTLLISRNGTEYQISDTAAPILDTAGKVRGVILVFSDVTDRYRAEQELRNLAEAVKQASEGVLVTGADGRILYANPAFEAITGCALGELSVTPPGFLRSGGDGPADDPDLWETILSGNRWTGRIADRRTDGSAYSLDCSVSPVKDTDGTLLNFIWICKDVTQDARVEERLNQAQKMEAIGTLAGGIAHDFNNILFPMLGYAEMLREDLAADSKLFGYVEEIFHAGLRARDLVQQILSFSRKSDQELMPIQLHPIVKEAVKLLRATIPKTIDIRQSIASDCGPVLADPTRIHQIVMNLATNAFHAMEAGGGVLTVSLKKTRMPPEDLPVEPVSNPGDYACLSITDTGVGIPKEILDRVFEPYFTTKPKDKGTGLGLSVVHGIVKSLGGEIRIESEPGKGTACRVYLPVVARRAGKADREAIQPVPGGNESILLVDDEAPIVRMEHQMLERLGYRVTSRTSSIEALEAFRAEPGRFDLVVTDMTMPNMTGVQLAEAVKRVDPKVPVILCTGFSEQVDEEKCRALGIQGYVLKPIIRKDIAEAIRKVLDRADPRGDTG